MISPIPLDLIPTLNLMFVKLCFRGEMQINRNNYSNSDYLLFNNRNDGLK